MSKPELKNKALKLRLQGKSYNYIKQELKVSKSTLSLWLNSHPLTKDQINVLRANSEIRIERFRQTMKDKREKRFADLYNTQKQLLPLSKKELMIAGLFLYWGEGLKDLRYSLALYNTNPQMIKFALYWYINVLHIPKEKIKIKLHLYSDMIISEEINYWSRQLNLPLIHFGKPYIKQAFLSNIKNKGTFGHGTCGLLVNDVKIKEKVMASIKVVADFYEKKI